MRNIFTQQGHLEPEKSHKIDRVIHYFLASTEFRNESREQKTKIMKNVLGS